MILVGDKNNSSKKIFCDSSNNYTPIKIGRLNNTASNVIKILIGDSTNKAKEVYFIPLYDWRGLFQYNDNAIEVIAKNNDNLYNRDPNFAQKSVNTFIFNPIYATNSNIYYMNLFDSGNYKAFNNMCKYSPYINNIEFTDTEKYQYYIGLCGYDNSLTGLQYLPNYSALEHIELPENIYALSCSFTHTPNLKSVFINNKDMVIDDDNISFSSHVDGCIILWKIPSIESSINYDYSKLISESSPALIIYPCIENTIYYSDALIEINSNNLDLNILASDYMALYNTMEDIDNILGNKK